MPRSGFHMADIYGNNREEQISQYLNPSIRSPRIHDVWIKIEFFFNWKSHHYILQKINEPDLIKCVVELVKL